jgi:hypothetical protein
VNGAAMIAFENFFRWQIFNLYKRRHAARYWKDPNKKAPAEAGALITKTNNQRNICCYCRSFKAY